MDQNKQVPLTQEEQDDKDFPAKDYAKKTFTFSTQEIHDLQPLEDAVKLVSTLITLAQIAQKAKDNYTATQVLPRLGTKQSVDSKFSYSIEENKIIVYEPKLWCVKCLNRKALYKYQDKIYCATCIEKVKKTLGEPIKEEKKPETNSQAKPA